MDPSHINIIIIIKLRFYKNWNYNWIYSKKGKKWSTSDSIKMNLQPLRIWWTVHPQLPSWDTSNHTFSWWPDELVVVNRTAMKSGKTIGIPSFSDTKMMNKKDFYSGCRNSHLVSAQPPKSRCDLRTGPSKRNPPKIAILAAHLHNHLRLITRKQP